MFYVSLHHKSKIIFMNKDLFRNRYRIASARADWHDYNHGYYFITICTDKREHFFGEIHEHKMTHSKLGDFANSSIDKINLTCRDAKILSHAFEFVNNFFYFFFCQGKIFRFFATV